MIEVRVWSEEKWREMLLLDICMCIVFAFQLIRANEVRIDIEVKRSEEKWREVMTCDVSPVAMFHHNHLDHQSRWRDVFGPPSVYFATTQNLSRIRKERCWNRRCHPHHRRHHHEMILTWIWRSLWISWKSSGDGQFGFDLADTIGVCRYQPLVR